MHLLSSVLNISLSAYHAAFIPVSYLCYALLAAVIKGVLAHVNQLSEKHLADLREPSAGWLHQGVQNGVDVGLDADLQQLLSFGENHRCVEIGIIIMKMMIIIIIIVQTEKTKK